MRRRQIDPGMKFGRLTVVKELPSSNGRRRVSCACDCGAAVDVTLGDILYGNTKSCGCLCRELTVARHKTHGQSKTRLYDIWINLRDRCFNPNNPRHPSYGCRGITVCDEWLSFEPFRAWAMANGYADDLTIERKDVDGNYEPGNCTFVPRSQQSLNTTKSRIITFNGESKTLSEWSKQLSIDRSLLIARIDRLGWSIEKALTTKVRRKSV